MVWSWSDPAWSDFRGTGRWCGRRVSPIDKRPSRIKLMSSYIALETLDQLGMKFYSMPTLGTPKRDNLINFLSFNTSKKLPKDSGKLNKTSGTPLGTRTPGCFRTRWEFHRFTKFSSWLRMRGIKTYCTMALKKRADLWKYARSMYESCSINRKKCAIFQKSPRNIFSFFLKTLLN